jgi:hypothetical protein
MKPALGFSLVAFGLALVGCRSPEVAFTDMDPRPAASIAGRLLTVRIGVDTNIPSSEVWVRVKAQVKDSTVCLAGYPSYYREESRVYSVPLPVSANSEALAVVWVNPDGSRVAVPVTK